MYSYTIFASWFVYCHSKHLKTNLLHRQPFDTAPSRDDRMERDVAISSELGQEHCQSHSITIIVIIILSVAIIIIPSEPGKEQCQGHFSPPPFPHLHHHQHHLHHLHRLGICQKIYTTQFSGERILHTENA